MVVDVFTCDDWCFGCCVLDVADFTGPLELGAFGLKSLSYVLVVAVAGLPLLDADYVVGMSLRDKLLMLNGLDGSMIVVLVYFPVDRTLDIFLFCFDNSPIFDSWVDSLVDCSLVLPDPGEEVGNCGLHFLHFYEVMKFVEVIRVRGKILHSGQNIERK
jgi:hypothetical protein